MRLILPILALIVSILVLYEQRQLKELLARKRAHQEEERGYGCLGSYDIGSDTCYENPAVGDR